MPTLIALSNLFWDVYVDDVLLNYWPEASAERNIIIKDPIAFHKIEQRLPQKLIEKESTGSSPSNTAIAYAGLGGDALIIAPAALGDLRTKISQYLKSLLLELFASKPLKLLTLILDLK